MALLLVPRVTSYLGGARAAYSNLRVFTYAESVGQFQPRVCFETLGLECQQEIHRNSESFVPGLPERNPGLELANAFSVRESLTKS